LVDRLVRAVAAQYLQLNSFHQSYNDNVTKSSILFRALSYSTESYYWLRRCLQQAKKCILLLIFLKLLFLETLWMEGDVDQCLCLRCTYI